MRLDVPLVSQPPDSVECGIASLNMVLAYHGDPVSYRQIKRGISLTSVGSATPQLGVFLLGRGYDVEIVTQHPGLLTREHRGMGGLEMLSYINGLYGSPEYSKFSDTLAYFKEYVHMGGAIKVDVPDASDIEEEISQGRPLIVLYTSNFLHKDHPRFNFHFSVVTGIGSGMIDVNDPVAEVGQRSYPCRDFFYGVYASAYADLDNASLMKIRPRQQEKDSGRAPHSPPVSVSPAPEPKAAKKTMKAKRNR